MIRLILLVFSPKKKENTDKESKEWCSERSIDVPQYIQSLTGESVIPLEKKFGKEFKEAEELTKELPVKMGGGGAVTLLYYLSEHIKATKVIETGVAHGWSTMALLLSLNSRKGSVLVSTDMPYAKMGNEKFVGCVIPQDLRENWTLIRKPDVSGLPEAFGILPEIDLCHYDSDKSYKGRMWAYPKLWQRLRKGGVFISDDIGDNMAFAHFCLELNVEPKVIRFNKQFVGIIIKE